MQSVKWGCVVLLAGLAASCPAQKLQPRDARENWCAPVELRIAAKLKDGSAADLAARDLQVEFDRGIADVVSATSFAKLQNDAGLTDILFVVPPYSEFGASAGIKGIVNTLAHAEGFRFLAAVLGPDGVTSGYSGESGVLDRELHAAAKGKHWLRELRRWVQAEQEAFLALRRQPGRHVIVRLFTGEDIRYPVQRNFLRESSLDTFAETDLAMMYRLLTPANVALNIPGGDAADSLDWDEIARLLDERVLYADTATGRQKAQLDAAIQVQAQLWARQGYLGMRAAGGAASDTAALMREVIRDLGSTYDVVVQPRFACRDAGFRTVRVATTRKDVRVFGPRLMQMIPYAAK